MKKLVVILLIELVTVSFPSDVTRRTDDRMGFPTVHMSSAKRLSVRSSRWF